MKANTNGYGDHIRTYIRTRPVREPITTLAVAADLTDTFGIDPKDAKNITNINMKRLSDKGELERVQKGIYGKTADTVFGRVAPNSDEMMSAVLLRDGNDAIGHITGPTLLNAVGLCTWMPKDIHIATNSFRRRISKSANVRPHKPLIPVNNNNVQYLQAIEILNAMERYPVDAESPDDILRELFRRNNLNNEKLIWFARKHCKQRTLMKAIDIVLGDLEI